MKLPDAFKPSPMPAYPWNGITAPPGAVADWIRCDSKIRLHNLARKVAQIAHKDARRRFVADMEDQHGAAFTARFKRLMAWYWRRQRRLQKQQHKK